MNTYLVREALWGEEMDRSLREQATCGLAFDHGRALAERDEALAYFRELCERLEDI